MSHHLNKKIGECTISIRNLFKIYSIHVVKLNMSFSCSQSTGMLDIPSPSSLNSLRWSYPLDRHTFLQLTKFSIHQHAYTVCNVRYTIQFSQLPDILRVALVKDSSCVVRHRQLHAEKVPPSCGKDVGTSVAGTFSLPNFFFRSHCLLVLTCTSFHCKGTQCHHCCLL